MDRMNGRHERITKGATNTETGMKRQFVTVCHRGANSCVANQPATPDGSTTSQCSLCPRNTNKIRNSQEKTKTLVK